MVREDGPVVAFMFIDRDRQTLEEQRPRTSHYPEDWICPGGGIKPGETVLDALFREVYEELRVVPVEFQELPVPQTIYSPTGRRVYPYIVSKWNGVIPSEVLDKKNPKHLLRWNPLSEAIHSPIESVKALALAAIDFLNNHDSN